VEEELRAPTLPNHPSLKNIPCFLQHNLQKTATSRTIRGTLLLLPTWVGTVSSGEPIHGTLNHISLHLPQNWKFHPDFPVHQTTDYPAFHVHSKANTHTERWTPMSKKNQHPTFQFPFFNQCFPAPLPVTAALFRAEEIPWTSRRNHQTAHFAA